MHFNNDGWIEIQKIEPLRYDKTHCYYEDEEGNWRIPKDLVGNSIDEIRQIWLKRIYSATNKYKRIN